MKNRHEVRGDEVIIYLKNPDGGEELELIIDSRDLEYVLELPVNKWNASKPRQSGKYYAKGYVRGDDSRYFHRQLFKPEKGMVVDHIDGNPLNNKRENIRIVTLAENNRNIRRKRGRDKDLPIGIDKVQRTYYTYAATVMRDGETYFIGDYPSIEEATRAREEFIKKLEEDS